MPNIKSAEKRMKTSAFQRLRNRSRRSALRTAVKKFEKSLDTGVEKAEELLAATMKELDQAAAAGVIHKNTAARKKSRLMRKINALNQAEAGE
ncbi:MAG TPA: 30S ribosomal protein S20 [Firmicutes bacterium]|jgi:small subunit ribosomal protein S20|nr:30S ribosomal protein S20 [Bacillota bacterium]